MVAPLVAYIANLFSDFLFPLFNEGETEGEKLTLLQLDFGLSWL
jgi:hypothetical protein